jgi:hypothetical protein
MKEIEAKAMLKALGLPSPSPLCPAASNPHQEKGNK